MKLHKRMSFFNAEGRRVRTGHNHTFTFPRLSTTATVIESAQLALRADDEQLMQESSAHPFKKPIFDDVGKTYYPGMTAVTRVPAEVSYIELNDLSPKLHAIGSGVVDMKIKSDGSDEIIFPKEIDPIAEIIRRSAAVEKKVNPEFNDWNMWLLVDRRPVLSGATQRNAGAHCDGFRMNQPTLQQTSVYTWCNILPTEATTMSFPIPSEFDSTRHNFSSVLTRDWDESTTVVSTPNYLYRMDGHTPHRGKVSDCDIDGRVFIRICFTPKGKEFNRAGNTPNPCFQYPEEYWQTVVDPASRFENITAFDTPEQFIRMWRNACQGHPSYGIVGSGSRSHEQRLVSKLKSQGPLTQLGIFKCYQQEIGQMEQTNTSYDIIEMEKMRLSLLKNKVF